MIGVAEVLTETLALIASTFKAAKRLAAEVVSAHVAALSDGLVNAMVKSWMKATLAVVPIVGLVAMGAGLLTYHAAAGQTQREPTPEKTVEPPAKPTKKEEPFTAWGKEVGGLQAGLGFRRSGEHRAYQVGETVKLVVWLRNVGKEDVSFDFLRHFLIENPPTVTDAKGKAIPFDDAVNQDGIRKGIYLPIGVNISPGKVIELYELEIELREKGNNQGGGVPKDSMLYGEGKFNIQYQRVLGRSTSLSSSPIKLDPALGKITTGKLQLEVKCARKLEKE